MFPAKIGTVPSSGIGYFTTGGTHNVTTQAAGPGLPTPSFDVAAAKTPIARMSKPELVEEARSLAIQLKSQLPKANAPSFSSQKTTERCLMATGRGVAYQNLAEWKTGVGGLYIPDHSFEPILCNDKSQEESLLREVVGRLRDKATFGNTTTTASANAVQAPPATVAKNVHAMSLPELEHETRALSLAQWKNLPDAATARPDHHERMLMATGNGVAYQNRNEWNHRGGLYVPNSPAEQVKCSDVSKLRERLMEAVVKLRALSVVPAQSPEHQKLETSAEKLIAETSLARYRVFSIELTAPGAKKDYRHENVIQRDGIHLKSDFSHNHVDNVHEKNEERFIALGRSIISAHVMSELGLGPRQYFKVLPDHPIAKSLHASFGALKYTTILTASETIVGKEIEATDTAPPEPSSPLATAGYVLQFNDLFSTTGKTARLHNVIVEQNTGKMMAFDYFSDSDKYLEKPKKTSIFATLGASREKISDLLAQAEKITAAFFARNDPALKCDAQYQEKSGAVMAGIAHYLQTCRNHLAQLDD